MNDILKFHIDNDYFVKLEKIEQINAIKVSFPECCLYEDFQIDKINKIYESSIDELTIYKNFGKLEKFNVDQITHKAIITLDIIYTCMKYNINTDLIVYFIDDEPKEYGFDNIIKMKLLNIEISTKELEPVLLMNKIITNKKYEHILNKYNFHKEKSIFKKIIELGGL